MNISLKTTTLILIVAIQSFLSQALADETKASIKVWKPEITYSLRDMAKGPTDGKIYISTRNQANNNPESDKGKNWIKKGKWLFCDNYFNFRKRMALKHFSPSDLVYVVSVEKYFKISKGTVDNGVTKISGGSLQGDIQGINGVINVSYAEAVGDGKEDDSDKIIAAIKVFKSNREYSLEFEKKKYRVTKKIAFDTINGLESGHNRKVIVGNGAILQSEVAPGKAAYTFYDSIGLDCSNLCFETKYRDKTYLDFSGLKNCTFRTINTTCKTRKTPTLPVFSPGDFWNNFYGCSFRELELNIGNPDPKRRPFNMNNFWGCKFWYGEYSISVYGTSVLNSVNFFGCDFSYYKKAIFYVDQQLQESSLSFWGCYFDQNNVDDFIDLKGLIIHAYGSTSEPSGVSLESNVLDDGSLQTIEVIPSGTSGSRLPIANENYVINGDLEAGTEGTSGNGLKAVINKDPVSFRGVTLNLNGKKGNRTFKTVPLPFSGYYTLTVISRLNSGKIPVTSCVVKGAKRYGTHAPRIKGEYCINNYTFKTLAKDVVSIAFSAPRAPIDLDIAYVGVTFGGQGVLYSPTSPSAKRIGRQINKSTVVSSSSATEIYKFDVPKNTRMSFVIDVYGVDSAYRDGAMNGRWSGLITRGSGPMKVKVFKEYNNQLGSWKGGSVSASLIDNGNDTASFKLQAIDGNMTISTELHGIFKLVDDSSSTIKHTGNSK